MSFDNPFDADRPLHARGCSCGRHGSQTEHDLAAVGSEDARIARVVEGAVVSFVDVTRIKRDPTSGS